MKKVNWKVFFVVILSFILFGCQGMNQFTPEEVVKNVLVAEDDMSFYGEYELRFLESGEEQMNMQVKEWRKNGRHRSEIDGDGESIVSVNDGAEIFIFDKNEQTVYTMNDPDLENVYTNPREQLDRLLDMIKDTHDIEIVGDEKILDRKTFHLVAKQKEGVNSLFGDQELSIDKEYWMVLKMKSMSGDNVSHLTYKEIQFHPKIEDAIFQLDLPEGVAVESLNEQVTQKEITIKELPIKMGSNVLYIPNGKEHEIGTITFTETTEPYSYKDVNIDYKKQGLPLMTLTIFNMEDEEILDEEINDNKSDVLDELGDFAENVQKETIRGEEGYYFEFDSLRSINWDEHDFSYSIDIIDPNVTIDEVLEWTEKMVHP